MRTAVSLRHPVGFAGAIEREPAARLLARPVAEAGQIERLLLPLRRLGVVADRGESGRIRVEDPGVRPARELGGRTRVLERLLGVTHAVLARRGEQPGELVVRGRVARREL